MTFAASASADTVVTKKGKEITGETQVAARDVVITLPGERGTLRLPKDRIDRVYKGQKTTNEQLVYAKGKDMGEEGMGFGRGEGQGEGGGNVPAGMGDMQQYYEQMMGGSRGGQGGQQGYGGYGMGGMPPGAREGGGGYYGGGQGSGDRGFGQPGGGGGFGQPGGGRRGGGGNERY
jgi:hypothetical protein